MSDYTADFSNCLTQAIEHNINMFELHLLNAITGSQLMRLLHNAFSIFKDIKRSSHV